jgi:iron complex transport system ATP-binding protein
MNDMILSCVKVTVPGFQRPRLSQVTCAIPSHSVTVILGENGSGKSTLLDCLSGLLVPEAGTVMMRDQNVSTLPESHRAQTVRSLGQLNPTRLGMGVLTRIGQGLIPKRGPNHLLTSHDIEHIHTLATALGLSHILDRSLDTLSGGEKRRVHLAATLMDSSVPIFVLDEPHAGVDVKHQTLVSQAIRERAAAGKTLIVSIHDLTTALAIGDYFIGLSDGHLVAEGPKHTFFQDETIKRLFGISGETIATKGGNSAYLFGA